MKRVKKIMKQDEEVEGSLKFVRPTPRENLSALAPRPLP